MDWQLTNSGGIDPLICKELAQQILRSMESMHAQKLERALADPNRFRHLDLAFYDRIKRQLEAKGFRHLGDYEIVSLTRTQKNMYPTFVRVLGSEDGITTAGIYQVKTISLWVRFLRFLQGQRDPKVIEFETEYADGTLVCTFNGEEKMAVAKQIEREALPKKSSAEEILKRHLQRIDARPRTSQPLLVRTLEDVFAKNDRGDAIRAKFRNELGGITKEELERIAPGKKAITDAVFEEIQRIRAERAQGEQGTQAT